jgi:hypothetical protein
VSVEAVASKKEEGTGREKDQVLVQAMEQVSASRSALVKESAMAKAMASMSGQGSVME